MIETVVKTTFVARQTLTCGAEFGFLRSMGHLTVFIKDATIALIDEVPGLGPGSLISGIPLWPSPTNGDLQGRPPPDLLVASAHDSQPEFTSRYPYIG